MRQVRHEGHRFLPPAALAAAGILLHFSGCQAAGAGPVMTSSGSGIGASHTIGADRTASAPLKSNPPVSNRTGQNEIQVQGVVVSAAAWVQGHPATSRYEVQITRMPTGLYRWDLYSPSWGTYDDEGFPGVSGEHSPTPYRKDQRLAEVTCTLRQYETLDETVTFHDIKVNREVDGFGFVTLTAAQTMTTPSGISVSLPVQNYKTFMPGGMFVYDGPPNVVFIRVLLSPGQKQTVLPNSPLYKRHRLPVGITVSTAPPVFMNSNSGRASLPQVDMTMTLSDEKATHIDTLTLVIRQRADLQSIPLSFEVPIERR